MGEVAPIVIAHKLSQSPRFVEAASGQNIANKWQPADSANRASGAMTQ
jgi:hypothetical protein